MTQEESEQKTKTTVLSDSELNLENASPESDSDSESNNSSEFTRREFLTAASGATLSCLALGISAIPIFSEGKKYLNSNLFRRHFRELSPDEKEKLLLEAKQKIEREFGLSDVEVSALPPEPNVKLAFALNLSACIGCRECVEACVRENNQPANENMEYIRVLSLPNGEFHPFLSDHYFDPELVPEEGRHYIPVQCQQCENPPCVAACPVGATWRDIDGIVVIDYNWCIGCRYCDLACPYWARRFNFRSPALSAHQLQKNMDIQSNYPRQKGVVEKCTFCLHRVRQGLYPACVEACPTGARKFGDLADADSEINYILRNKRIFIFRAELNTKPRFYYYFD